MFTFALHVFQAPKKNTLGHLISGKSDLIPLIDRLNRYPVGLVDNELRRGFMQAGEKGTSDCLFPLELSPSVLISPRPTAATREFRGQDTEFVSECYRYTCLRWATRTTSTCTCPSLIS
jgi:hypothetical protein